MRTKVLLVVTGAAVAALGFGVLSARDGPAAPPKKNAAAEGQDRAAIEKASHEFAKAFDKGDAKAVAALWTENGEYEHLGGAPVVGRAAIEKAFTAYFKDNPGGRIEVLTREVRFPAPGLAVEEGLLRLTGAGKALPSTTRFSTTLVRDGRGWKIATSREWGAGQDRLEDLDWLVGTWRATVGGQEVSLSFSRDEGKPFLTGRFTKKAKDRVVSSGSLKVGLDAHSGKLRSWHFDDDGGHGQALWLRDGNRWVLDSIGALGDGRPTASLNILGRVGNDKITWRSIDRVADGRPLPDTVPINLKRAGGK